ncbi:uncharacterized protein PFL1_05954 [Pseudozyma flocculosa PF-1]|nr:uncharacterized protein PFL1_05954 [Pseudozyma flocculosa PF-1]EPQ26633.1 hypothetical protein PFL1_05954 [Pseudozyma flocculosa PF-1]
MSDAYLVDVLDPSEMEAVYRKFAHYFVHEPGEHTAAEVLESDVAGIDPEAGADFSLILNIRTSLLEEGKSPWKVLVDWLHEDDNKRHTARMMNIVRERLKAVREMEAAKDANSGLPNVRTHSSSNPPASSDPGSSRTP